MDHEHALDGGNTGGAVRRGQTVLRKAGPWTSSVHALLRHLEASGFDRAPKPLGMDSLGREVLSFLPGETVGSREPWPPWVHSDQALVEVAWWLREFHDAVENFRVPADAVWREGGRHEPGQIIGHNDAAPYNAAWADGKLVGFFDWDFAGPVSREWDLAFTAFAWVPLHARSVVAAEGFTAFADRPRRLRLFLEVYGWEGPITDFVCTIQARATALADAVGRIAAAGDPAFQRMLDDGTDVRLRTAVAELDDFYATFEV